MVAVAAGVMAMVLRALLVVMATMAMAAVVTLRRARVVFVVAGAVVVAMVLGPFLVVLPVVAMAVFVVAMAAVMAFR